VLASIGKWQAEVGHEMMMVPVLAMGQGHIALDSAVFPEGTPGLALDTLARSALWSEGLNYRHGTGHGVGAALNVHEGPHSISTRCPFLLPSPLYFKCSFVVKFGSRGGVKDICGGWGPVIEMFVAVGDQRGRNLWQLGTREENICGWGPERKKFVAVGTREGDICGG
jgi:Metallopeptidase family M24